MKASDLEAKVGPFLSWPLVPDSAVVACTPGHNQHWEVYADIYSETRDHEKISPALTLPGGIIKS